MEKSIAFAVSDTDCATHAVATISEDAGRHGASPCEGATARLAQTPSLKSCTSRPCDAPGALERSVACRRTSSQGWVIAHPRAISALARDWQWVPLQFTNGDTDMNRQNTRNSWWALAAGALALGACGEGVATGEDGLPEDVTSEQPLGSNLGSNLGANVLFDMANQDTILCPYCGTRFRFDPKLGPVEADPPDCLYS